MNKKKMEEEGNDNPRYHHSNHQQRFQYEAEVCHSGDDYYSEEDSIVSDSESLVGKSLGEHFFFCWRFFSLMCRLKILK
jgi:hypothetical protein